MLMKRIYLIFALCSAWVAGMACTNFLVGKDASVDGSTMVSYAADSYALYGFLHFVPASDYPAGAVREVNDWDTGKPLCSIPQVAHTYNVVGNMNEHQLTIGETTWGGRPELEIGEGIDYGSLIYIALERCKTAREAIKCMTDLVAEYGYASSGETFSIADPNEVWMMELIGKGKVEKGAVWVATRVPDDCIAAHANQARITTINFKDKENWMWSKDVVKFARKQGYFTGKKDEEFNFQEAYAPYDFSGLYVCEARVWSFFRKFSNDMDKYFDFASGKTFVETNGKYAGERMPLYIKPNHKVSAQELKDCMRDLNEQTYIRVSEILFKIILTLSERVEHKQETSYVANLVKEALDNAIYRKVTIEEIAKEINFSKSQMTREFRKYYGVTPYKYLLDRKIVIAKQLLTSTGMRVQEISEALGFVDAYYFSDIFKTKTGHSPMAFRKTQRESDN